MLFDQYTDLSVPCECQVVPACFSWIGTFGIHRRIGTDTDELDVIIGNHDVANRTDARLALW